LVNDNVLIDKQDHKLAVKADQLPVVAGVAADRATQEKRGQVAIFPSILIPAAMALWCPPEKLCGDTLVFIVSVFEMARLLFRFHGNHQPVAALRHSLSKQA
jgi:hypothetical protein